MEIKTLGKFRDKALEIAKRKYGAKMPYIKVEVQCNMWNTKQTEWEYSVWDGSAVKHFTSTTPDDAIAQYEVYLNPHILEPQTEIGIEATK